MEITPEGWMSFIAGIIAFFFVPLVFASLAVGIGVLTWSNGKLGKIGLILGVLAIAFMVIL